MKSMGCTPTGRHSVIFVDACFIVLLFPSPKFSITSKPSSFLSTCNFYLQYTLPNNLISCKNKMQFMLKKNTINVLLKVVSIDRKIFLSTLHKITIMFSRRVLIALLEFVNGHWPWLFNHNERRSSNLFHLPIAVAL